MTIKGILFRPSPRAAVDMYLVIVVALMFALPVGSIVAEVVVSGAPLSLAVVGKWFALWAVGARLFLAGLRQIIQPRYTAEVVLSLKSPESLLLVRELGFANVALGVVGLGGLVWPSWRGAAALCGGLFYAFAGANHVLQAQRGRLENVAMVSDLWAAAILLVCTVSLIHASA